MKYILVLDKGDEQRMHQGEMIPIPGQVETFITMEPKRGNRVEALVDGERPARASRAPLSMVKCEKCGESFKGAVGVSTHSRHCTGERQTALPAPSSSSATCRYCRRGFRNVQARSAHQANCPQKPRKGVETHA